MRKMKISLAIVCLLIFGNSISAQNVWETASAARFQREFVSVDVAEPKNMLEVSATSHYMVNEEKYRKFKKLRTGGIVLTCVGAGMLIGGTVLMIDGSNKEPYYSWANEHDWDDEYYLDSDDKIIAGAVGIVMGALSVGGGITMWVIGNNKMKKYGGGSVQLHSSKNGIGLAYKF